MTGIQRTGPFPKFLRATLPLWIVLGFVIKWTYFGMLGWWLNPRMQRKANQSLWEDIQDMMPFFGTTADRVKTEVKVLPFDIASVYADKGSLRVCITRGKRDLVASVASLQRPEEMSRLTTVLKALGDERVAKHEPLKLREMDDLLRLHWSQLEDAFSENQYPEFKEAIVRVRDDEKILIRQAQWELDKGLHR
jgi:hypothetical protein